MGQYKPEGPRVVDEGPLSDLASQIVEWMGKTEPRHGWVAGVYGGRGSGKTSLLTTIIQRLAQTKAPTKFVLPQVEDLEEQMICPAQTRSEGASNTDDQLFAILRHLSNRAQRPDQKTRVERILKRARTAEVRRRNSAEFVAYAKDIATSTADIPRRLVRVHKEISETTDTIRRAFEEACAEIRHKTKILPIFFDDLDLRPDRSLEILELIHGFLQQPGVVVLIAADKDQLLQAIQDGLSRRHRVREAREAEASLAPQLLAKYVPVEWWLPVPSQAERVTTLWEASKRNSEGEPPELPAWWATADLSIFDAGTSRDAAESHVGPLLPNSYRGLKGVHNRLVAVSEQLQFGSPQFQGLSHTLGFSTENLAPFLSMVVATEVQFPEIGLLRAVTQMPDDASATFLEMVTIADPTISASNRAVVRPAAETRGEAKSGEKRELNWNLVVLDRIQMLPAYRKRVALRCLHNISSMWRKLARNAGQATPQDHFVAVSLNNNAMELGRPVWEPRGFEESQLLHIDARFEESLRRATVAELRAAVQLARTKINETGLTALGGRISLLARAQIPFMIWLGAALRDLHNVVAFNYFTTARGDEFEAFQGPTRRLNPPASRTPKLLLERAAKRVDSDTAVLLVDLLGRATVAQLNAFSSSLPAPARARLLTRTEIVSPDQLEDILSDILAALGRLREEGVKDLHLGFAGPDVVAFFLGQQLNAQGMRIRLYEFYTDHYEYVFDLEGSSD
jgi:hypothetical protein